MFQARGHEPFVTTVGQLNFFRWSLEKDILTYIAANIDPIEKDMNTSMREHYSSTSSSTSDIKIVAPAQSSIQSTQSSDSSTRRKRTELSKSALKKVNLHQCEIMVSFG
jgi:hypothetical protein